ncbi:CMRF35-like molecule 5 isoform X1 [Ctenopharyngodon idella]|uniref:CMRF35-like molecule 5 isoform X1 n=1 Tax=Ctenopharyngodon idella TaxID=7959 RepID=UPI0022310AFA|nr:CMRF35-like molecule 5 isoform X1 [Ctenopharyngodon idella]
MIHICDHKLLIFNLLLIMSVVACEMKENLTFTAYEGGKVEIRCLYESGYETYNKYLCRGECPILNKDILVESGSAAKDERFSLTDNTTTHIFTVTITDLKPDDQGQYWCAVRTGLGKYDDYTEIYLEIKHVTSESPKPTTTASDHSSKPATADTASNRPVTSVFPSSSTTTTSSSALLMLSSSNNAASSKPESGFTMIVMLIVIGILTGFGFSLFMYFRCRQKKEGNQPRDVVQGPTEHLPNGDNEPNRGVSDYENISNTLDNPVYSSVLPVFDEHNTSVYALAQLPSSPSDNLTYSSIKFSATPHSDRTSDGQDTCTTVRP